MNDDQLQEQMSPEDLRAGLGFANTLLEGTIPKDMPMEEMPQEEAVEEASAQEGPEDDRFGALESKIDDLTKLIKERMSGEDKKE